MDTKKLMYLAIAGVVAYIIWKRFFQQPATVVTPTVTPEPIIVPEEPKTQGDIVNELAFARG